MNTAIITTEVVTFISFCEGTTTLRISARTELERRAQHGVGIRVRGQIEHGVSQELEPLIVVSDILAS